ncbi:hypothetical protein ATCC90586_008366 [Pythium insidiosum]|nr:hypothetical protein ATCC90586_008366 [Pythium insidiosum]
MSGPPPTRRSLGFSIRNVVLREYDLGRDGLVGVWIESVRKAIAADEAMMGGRWPEPPLYHLASGKLLGNAATWLRQYERATPMEDRSLDHFFGALKERFGTKLDRLAQRNKRVGESYAEMKGQGDNSSVKQYAGRRATISYETCEATFMDEDTRVIVPFTFDGAKTGAIRLARGYKVATQTQRLLRVPAAAPEGSVGLFLPGDELSPRLLVPPTLVTVRGGQVTVSVLNVLGQKAKLPARTQLGRWVPLDADIQVIEAQGGLQRDAVMCWIDTLNRGDSKPLSGEDELSLNHLSRDDKDMLIKIFAVLSSRSVDGARR